MTAIITDILKKQLLSNVFNEISANTHRYFLGIGRSEQWNASETVPTPTDAPKTIRDARSSLQSIKSASDVSFVIPRYNWSSGAIYQAYDDTFTSIPASNSYYVLTEDNQVYICLQQGKDNSGAAVTSTVKPTGTTTIPFKTADGYVWKFLFALSASRASKFLSANFVPVEKVLDSSELGRSLTTIETQQETIQNACTPGQVLGVAITNGGTGYTSTPTVTIQGDGVGAAATATVSGGAVVKIELDSSTDSTMSMGHGYNFVGAVISGGGGSGASARVILGPDSGLGNDPRDELKSTSLMFNTKPNGTESGNFIIDQDFRQVVLMRDPTDSADSAYSGASGKVLQFLQTTNATQAASFAVDTLITGATSTAKAVVDEIDSDKILFHQNDSTGFLPFTEGEAISGGGGAATLEAAGVDTDSNAFGVSTIKKTSGEILYIENRAPVVRSSNQTEDIKVVITL